MKQKAVDVGEEEEIIDRAREKLKDYVTHTLFWLLVTVFTIVSLAEPILIGFQQNLPYETWMKWQFVLLSFSTVCYFLLLAATYYFVGLVDQELDWKSKIVTLFDGEVLFETVCLALGWAFIVENPGIASLRCMRIFRMLWFFELGEHKSYKVPEDHWVSISNICYICVQYLEGIAAEIFTAKSKGGLVLLIIYFYVTYVFAILFYIEEDTLSTPNDTNPTTGNSTLCATITGCYLTLTRLNLYDGTGYRYFLKIASCLSLVQNAISYS